MEVELPEKLKKMLSESVAIIYGDRVEYFRLLDSLQLISMGAESYIFRARFMGIDSVIKWRFPREYIPKEFDYEMRRSRTELEAKIMLKALSLNVNVPTPLFVDLDDCILIMTFIEGENLRDVVKEVDKETLCRITKTVGSYAATLHRNGIVHGDLTTSNVIVSKGDVYLIDFGLASFSKRLEDMAIDVHIFFRSVESAHYTVGDVMKSCFIDGYKAVAGEEETNKVLKTVQNIRLRGRYVAARKFRSEWV